MLDEANARQRREAKKLCKKANETNTRIIYTIPEGPIKTGKIGAYRFYLVRATPTYGNREGWNYYLSSCYGGTRGWFPGAEV